MLVPDLRLQQPETPDFAASAHARVDRVALGANPLVAAIFKVEAAIEIERRAVLVELRPDARTVGEQEVDLVRAGEHRAADHPGGDAFGTLVLDPFDPRDVAARLDRHAQDHLVLHDEAGDDRLHVGSLRGEQAEQQGYERDERPRDQGYRPTIAG